MYRLNKIGQRYKYLYNHSPHVYRGSGLIPIHRGPIIQRGAGIGSILKGLIRFIQPVFRKGIRTLTKSGKKFIQNEAVKSLGNKGSKMLMESGKNILADVVKGTPIKESVKKELNQTKEKIRGELVKLIDQQSDQIIKSNKKIKRRTGNVRKRKKKNGITHLSKKKLKKGDIFS
jgi:hypothetical protein